MYYNSNIRSLYNNTLCFCFKRLLSGPTSENAVQQLYEMSAEPNIDQAVRSGDIYAAVIEQYAQAGNFKMALSALQEMRSKIPKVRLFPMFKIKVEISRICLCLHR